MLRPEHCFIRATFRFSTSTATAPPRICTAFFRRRNPIRPRPLFCLQLRIRLEPIRTLAATPIRSATTISLDSPNLNLIYRSTPVGTPTGPDLYPSGSATRSGCSASRAACAPYPPIPHPAPRQSRIRFGTAIPIPFPMRSAQIPCLLPSGSVLSPKHFSQPVREQPTGPINRFS